MKTNKPSFFVVVFWPSMWIMFQFVLKLYGVIPERSQSCIMISQLVCHLADKEKNMCDQKQILHQLLPGRDTADYSKPNL